MNELVMSLRVLLGNTFVMYFKAQSHHWNVEGINFSQFHDFFGKLYEDVYGSIDHIAEEIRAMREYAPRTISEIYEYKTLNEGNVSVTVEQMLQDLQNANDGVLESLNKSMEIATRENKQGLADFLAGRIDTHEKHGWMIRSHLK
jgi:starvation-inducible DNA-binding protein